MKKFIILLGIIIVLLTGCNSSKVEPVTNNEEVVNEEDPIEEISEEEQELILKEYYDYLKADSEKLNEFLYENISKLSTSNVDKIIISLEDHLKSKNTNFIDIIRTIEKYKDFASDEIKSYINVLMVESEAPFTDGEGIFIKLEEILTRAKESEKHLKDYPDGESYRRVYDYYYAYVTGAIIGAGNQFVYANDGDSTIKEEVINQYKSYIEDNKDSYTSKILASYLEELNLDNMDLNGPNVIKFYDSLDDIIKLNSR